MDETEYAKYVRLSRRKFLGVSAAAAVGGVVGGIIVGAVGGYLAGLSASTTNYGNRNKDSNASSTNSNDNCCATNSHGYSDCYRYYNCCDNTQAP